MNNAYNIEQTMIINNASDAAETIRWAAEDLKHEDLLNAMFDIVEGSHCSLYLDLLEAAGRRAAEMKKEMWQKENAHRIVSCGPELSRR